MRFGQFVEREHADNRRERGGQNRQFKCDGNEHRPTVERTAADIDGIISYRRIPLHEITADAAAIPAIKTMSGTQDFFRPKFSASPFHGKRRERIHFAIAVFVRDFAAAKIPSRR